MLSERYMLVNPLIGVFLKLQEAIDTSHVSALIVCVVLHFILIYDECAEVHAHVHAVVISHI